MIVTTKRLNALYRSMIAEPKGQATMNYILALMSINDALRMENEGLKANKSWKAEWKGKEIKPLDHETPS